MRFSILFFKLAADSTQNCVIFDLNESLYQLFLTIALQDPLKPNISLLHSINFIN